MSLNPNRSPLPDLAPVGPVSADAPPSASPHAEDRAHLARGASWFYWLAGLSLVNTILSASGASVVMIFGLGASILMNGVAAAFGPVGVMLSYSLEFLMLVFYCVMGALAHRGHGWAFALGMLAYVGDAVITLFLQDWLILAVHGYVLFHLWRGFRACRAMQKG